MKKNLYTTLPVLIFFVFSASSFTKAATHTIIASDFQFSPDTMTIEPGDTITWKWESGIHTTTSNGIPPGAAPWNELLDSMHLSFTYIATVPGVYHYISVPDLPAMAGTFTIPGAEVGIANAYISPVNFDLISNLVDDHVTLSYSVLAIASIDVALYNISGTRLQTFLHETVPVGKYQSSFYLKESYPAGMYFVRMQAGNVTLTRRLVIQ